MAFSGENFKSRMYFNKLLSFKNLFNNSWLLSFGLKNWIIICKHKISIGSFIKERFCSLYDSFNWNKKVSKKFFFSSKKLFLKCSRKQKIIYTVNTFSYISLRIIFLFMFLLLPLALFINSFIERRAFEINLFLSINSLYASKFILP